MWESTAWLAKGEQILFLLKEDKQPWCTKDFLKEKLCEISQPLLEIHAFCMFYRSSRQKEGTFISETETGELSGVLHLFWMHLKGKHACGGLTVRKSTCSLCFDSFVNAEIIVVLHCRLTACVKFSALLNTKAFSPHKLGTEDFNRTVLCVSLFSNTVTNANHPWESTTLSQGVKLFHVLFLFFCFCFFCLSPSRGLCCGILRT